MPIRIVIRSPEQEKPIKMDVDPADYIDEIIESVADFWGLNPSQYLLKKNVTVYSRDTKIGDTDVDSEDILELVKEEDIIREREAKAKESQVARDWIFDNVGIPQNALELEKESYEEDDHVMIFQNKSDKRRYKIIFNKNHELKEYRPL